MVNILVIGSGGREHALSWKLAQSTKVDTVYTAPGNGGTENNIPIGVTDIEGLANFAQDNNCFTVVGPEDPLAEGIVDKFNQRNLKVFGPSKNAAQLESSKIWSKNFMKRNNIPTARFEIFDDAQKAIDYVKSLDYNVVVKADGLAAGKGVIVCSNVDDAVVAIQNHFGKKKHLVKQETELLLRNELMELRLHLLPYLMAKLLSPMASSQDHKRIFDDDKGPNTGGMGAYSPTPVIDTVLENKIQRQIIEKTIQSMKKEGMPFKGFSVCWNND